VFAALPLRADVVRLGELEKRAIEVRAGVAAERARVGAASARVDAARAPLYPTIVGTAQVEAAPGGRLIRIRDIAGDEYLTQGWNELGNEGAFRPEVRYGASLAFTSRLYDFGRTASAVRAAEAEVGAARAGVRSAQVEIVLEVRAAYLGWLFAHGARRILSSNVEAALALRQAVEGRVAEGTRPAAELAVVRHDEARAGLELARAEGQLAAARLELERAAGVTLAGASEPDLSVLSQPSTPSATAEPQAPRVRAIEQQRDAALATARAHGRARAPVLSAAGEAGVRGQTDTFFPAYRLGVSLSVPIFDGGLSSASAAVAHAQANELGARAREARARSTFELAALRAELTAAENRLHFAAALEQAAGESLTHAEAQRDVAGGSSEAVIQARVRRAEAELEVLAARVARAQAGLRLASVAPPP